jgi:hypothetical protein
MRIIATVRFYDRWVSAVKIMVTAYIALVVLALLIFLCVPQDALDAMCGRAGKGIHRPASRH